MKILKFHAENVMNIRAIDITPDPNNPAVLLTGPNGAGKTSVLDAIELAMAGAKAFDNGKTKKVRALRDGEDHAEVTIEFGEYTVTRTWDRKGDGTIATAMILTNAKGYEQKKPQTILDGFWGKLSFDPLLFATMNPKDQQKTLTDLVDLGFDPVKVESQKATLTAERLAVGQRLKVVDGELKSYPKPPADLPAEEQSATDLIDEHRRAVDANRAIADAGAEYQTAATRVGNAVDFVENLKRELDQAQADVAARQQELAEAEAVLKNQPDPIDVDGILARLDTIEVTNDAVRTELRRQQAAKKVAELDTEYKGYTKQLADLDKMRADALAAAKFPLPGLGFDDDGVTLNGVPFGSGATGDQIAASTAIGFALNPDLKVVRISRGESLDAAHLAIVTKIAAENDGQVWIEVVDESQQNGVVIREGRVVSTPESRAAEASA